MRILKLPMTVVLTFALMFSMSIVLTNNIAYADSYQAGIISTQSNSLTTQSTKTVTVKPFNFDSTKKTVDKATSKVKTGTYKLNYKKHASAWGGFVKFTAPKTKTYSFKFYNYKAKQYAGYVSFYKIDKYSSDYISSSNARVSTKGGKTNTLWLAAKGMGNQKTGKTVDRCLETRTGKIKLNKGETIYMYTSFREAKSASNINLKIS